MKVYFGRRNGEKTLGKIVKVNAKNFKVEALEERGTTRSHQAGGRWNVPPSLCTPADASAEAGAPAPKRAEVEIMEAISHAYCGLSPENLSCDGEASFAWVRRRGTALRRELRGLFRELGREVDDYENSKWLEAYKGGA